MSDEAHVPLAVARLLQRAGEPAPRPRPRSQASTAIDDVSLTQSRWCAGSSRMHPMHRASMSAVFIVACLSLLHRRGPHPHPQPLPPGIPPCWHCALCRELCAQSNVYCIGMLLTLRW